MVSGTAEQGQVLSTTNGSWTNSPTGYAYGWEDCDSSGAGCVTISGATSSSYTLTAGDVGHTVRSVVTASDSGGSTSASSAATGVVASSSGSGAGAPVNTGLPLVSSTGPQVAGSTVSASVGSWSNAPSSYSYQWEDCVQSRPTALQCAPISGATSGSYTLQSSDVNNTVAVRVTASNASGSASASSIQTGMIGAAGTHTYYISYTNGSDANPGTKAAPWKRAPGMRGFSGSYTHNPGDRFILEGGDTWPNGVFSWNAANNGLGGSSTAVRDYWGVETDWFMSGSCAGATFCRPILNPGGTELANPGDAMIDVGMTDHIIVDDMEITGYYCNSPQGFANCVVFNISNGGTVSSGDQDIIANRMYVHDWRITAHAAGGNNDPMLFYAPPQGTAGNSVIENSTLIDPGSKEYGRAIYCWPNVLNSTVLGFTEEVFPCGHGTIAYDNIGDCGRPQWPSDGGTLDAGHSNAIEALSSDGAFYIHDNVIHDTYADNTGECESMFLGNTGESDYVYNNVFYHIDGNKPGAPQNGGGGEGGGPNFYFVNNSIEASTTSTNGCMGLGNPNGAWNYGTHYDVENNLCIDSLGTVSPDCQANGLTGCNGVDPSIVPCNTAPCPIAHNILMTLSQATTAGYTTDTGQYVWQPPTTTTATGANLTPLCPTMPGLCSQTNYANTRTPTPRPTTGAWNIGAF